MNFEMYAGDSVTLDMTIDETDGTSIDLSGSTVTWSAKSLVDGSVVTLTEGAGVVVAGSPVGEVTVTISVGTITVIGGYRHQLEAVDAGVSRTLVHGYIRVAEANRPST